jgi:hypothetical protein
VIIFKGKLNGEDVELRNFEDFYKNDQFLRKATPEEVEATKKFYWGIK